MGRLTLILLSFAQFEREMIGERIRDKFAASRARGMWMGGKVPLGYRVCDRKLVVNEPEAVRVRSVFEDLTRQVRCQDGASTPGQGHRRKSGKPIDKGDLYKLLNNRTYRGEVVHKGHIYAGEHKQIVCGELWDRVHAIMQESPRARANRTRSQTPALLRRVGSISAVTRYSSAPTT